MVTRGYELATIVVEELNLLRPDKLNEDDKEKDTLNAKTMDALVCAFRRI